MVGAVLAIGGGTTVGAIFVFMILGGQLASSMLQLSSVSEEYQDARAAMDSLADVLGHGAEDSLAASTMLPLPTIEGRVDLDKVSFSYGLTSERQLDQFSVSLAAGRTMVWSAKAAAARAPWCSCSTGFTKQTKAAFI